jgi:hypothetical protein
LKTNCLCIFSRSLPQAKAAVAAKSQLFRHWRAAVSTGCHCGIHLGIHRHFTGILMSEQVFRASTLKDSRCLYAKRSFPVAFEVIPRARRECDPSPFYDSAGLIPHQFQILRYATLTGGRWHGACPVRTGWI